MTSSQKTMHKAKQRGAARDERSEDLKSEDHAQSKAETKQHGAARDERAKGKTSK